MSLEVDWFSQLMKQPLQAFHTRAISAAGNALMDNVKNKLQDNWTKQYETMERDGMCTVEWARRKQRGINRKFADGVEEYLHPTYLKCAYEYGNIIIPLYG